jgi:hypothetical protein
MRDYVAWYLIELRRRLVNVEPQSRVEDFLLETRAHLHESIEDMTERGVPEVDATKSAITDFGQPSLVAAAFRGKRRMRDGVYWVLVCILFFMSIPAIVQMVRSATDNAMGYWHVLLFDFGIAVGAVIAGISLLGFFSRRWCVVPVAMACLIATTVVGVWFTNTTRPYASEPGTERFVLLDRRSAKGQVEYRDKLIDAIDEVVPKIEHDLSRPMGAEMSEMLRPTHGLYTFPYGVGTSKYSSFHAYTIDLPFFESSWIERSTGHRPISLAESKAPEYVMGQTTDINVARQAWDKHGAAYVATLKEAKLKAQREREWFRSPIEVQSGAVMSRLLLAPIALVSAFSLITALANAFAILLSDLRLAVARRRWKRMLN